MNFDFGQLLIDTSRQPLSEDRIRAWLSPATKPVPAKTIATMMGQPIAAVLPLIHAMRARGEVRFVGDGWELVRAEELTGPKSGRNDSCMTRRATPGSAERQISSGAEGQRLMDKLNRLGMSPRQRRLNALYAVYKCLQYDVCKWDWDGTDSLGALEHEVIASANEVPTGFYDPAGGPRPLKFRRPAAPYPVIPVIVNRFTGMLIDEKKRPQVKVRGDEQTSDYVAGLIEASDFWSRMVEARNFGGSTGTVAIGFLFEEGKPVIEIHDPRWCTPQWRNRRKFLLSSVDIRYQYPIEVRDEYSGRWEEVPHWYRRLITETDDTLWKPIPVTEDEPDWSKNIDQRIEHNLGFCPVIWVQNMPCGDDIDGEPDCPPAVYELSKRIDMLLSGGTQGTLANCDPTVVVKTNAELAKLKKGSENAIKLPGTGDDAHYMEMVGSGLKLAFEQARELREYALEVAQCVLVSPEVAGRTATEIERQMSSMFSKVNLLRGQWGTNAIKAVLDMMLRTAWHLEKIPVVEINGKPSKLVVELPPKITIDKDGKEITGERKLGTAGVIELKWPQHVEPTPQDCQSAVQAASTAKTSGIVDRDHTSRYVAPFFGVENIEAMMENIEAEEEEARARQEEMMSNRLREAGLAGAGGAGAKEEEEEEPELEE